MDKAKLKELLANLKEVITELESEIYSDVQSYSFTGNINDYDEVFEDDDGYPF